MKQYLILENLDRIIVDFFPVDAEAEMMFDSDLVDAATS